MPKLTLTDIASGYASITELNQNFTAIENAIENTVSRDGTTPNQMNADLDMNGNSLLNVGDLSVDGIGLVASVDAAAASAAASAASANDAAASEAAVDATIAAAVASATATAVAAANSATATYDAFDDRYLGAKGSAPSVDNDGNALATGSLYWNTATNQLYVWTGAAWEAGAFALTGDASGVVNTPAGTISSLTVQGAINELDGDIAALSAVYQPLDADLTAIAGLTSAANKVPMFSGSGTATLLDFKDEDNMASNSATAVPSQQSVKAYVDGLVPSAVTSGTYTPTFTVDANLDSVAINSSSTPFRYTRIGNVVHVTGAVQVDPTAASTAGTSFYLTLPVASTITNISNLCGVASSPDTSVTGVGVVYGDSIGNRARVMWKSGSATTSGLSMYLVFSYDVV